MSVLNRDAPEPNRPTPALIDWDDGEMSAAVHLADATLAAKGDWLKYVRAVELTARQRDHRDVFFPVTIDAEGLAVGFEAQAPHGDRWDGNLADRAGRLTRDITHK